jgi:hypothetical protein
VVRVVDYDERTTIAELPPVDSNAASGDLAFDFAPPPNVLAVRLRLDPARPGAPASFRLTTAQVEALTGAP